MRSIAIALLSSFLISVITVGCSTANSDAEVTNSDIEDVREEGEIDSGEAGEKVDTADLSDAKLTDTVDTADVSNNGSGSKDSTDGDSVNANGEHRKIGWGAELSTKAHRVDGEAVIVDERTIEIRNFTYDGQGPAAAVYGAKEIVDEEMPQTALEGKFRISDDLEEQYDGSTLTVELPEDKTLDDLNVISIWCYEFDVDFGSGTFAPN